MSELENFNDGYYHFSKDLLENPDCWLYATWSRRGPGKTYSSLWYSLYNEIPVLYMKRTIKDVDLITTKNSLDFDPSPYFPINRDKGTNIKAVKIKEGLGAFYHTNADGEPTGKPVSYILSLSAVKQFKGFDFSICDWIIFDEFIPQRGEIIRQSEGEQLLDLYMTVARDRQKRGKPPLKLVLFANAEEISTPITRELDIVDTMADMNASGLKTYKYKGMFLHHITEEEYPLAKEEKIGIYETMEGTSWWLKSFGGDFANNDFTNVVKLSLKHMRCMFKLHYKQKDYYIYLRSSDGMYYMCYSKGKPIFTYNLDRENEQKKFYYEHLIDLEEACIDDKMKFEKYTMYDLIINYKKFFTL